ncbi:MAG: hypothetical protein KGL44_02720 [Sphingomonadales bacterium]|nr:hypothetical protein [Sphingomonadales bacterium]
MSRLLKAVKMGLATGVVALGIVVPASGQRPPLAMLDQLERGRWELRMRDAGATIQTVCLQDGRRLIQLRHPQNACERYVVDDQADDVTVQYTCRGRGYGRTHIRRESGRLVQIETQGIADGLPFNFIAEGRRVGDCPA